MAETGPTEAQFQAVVVKELKLAGCEVCPSIDGRAGRGWPDLVVSHASFPGTVWMELKTWRRGLTKWQERRITRLLERRAPVFILKLNKDLGRVLMVPYSWDIDLFGASNEEKLGRSGEQLRNQLAMESAILRRSTG